MFLYVLKIKMVSELAWKRSSTVQVLSSGLFLCIFPCNYWRWCIFIWLFFYIPLPSWKSCLFASCVCGLFCRVGVRVRLLFHVCVREEDGGRPTSMSRSCDVVGWAGVFCPRRLFTRVSPWLPWLISSLLYSERKDAHRASPQSTGTCVLFLFAFLPQ